MDTDNAPGVSKTKEWADNEVASRAAEKVRAIISSERGKDAVRKTYQEALRTTTLPDPSAERKEFPILEGVVKYFPAALAAVARISKIGNDKHNGAGTPLQHSRGLSMDHGDCILRHLVDLFEDRGRGVGYDENGVPQVGYIAWRALALAQEWLEVNQGAPLAPNAKVSS